MRDLAVLFLHLLVTVARLAGPAGADRRLGRHAGESPGVSVAAARSRAVSDGDGRMTRSVGNAFTAAIYEFATRTSCVHLSLAMILAATTLATAQQNTHARDSVEPAAHSLPTRDAPQAPIPPNVINRDDQGHATIRATRVKQPLTIDGLLDEKIYQVTPAASGFMQAMPREGAPATEQTDIWVFFDDNNLYLAGRCNDSHPEREIVNELRRDNALGINGNEALSFGLDTFLDKRNGYSFQTNALGMIRDQAISDNKANDSWNTVWEVKTHRDQHGWTAEFAIPFKSLRYNGSGPQVWGLQARRYVRWSNEMSHLTRVSGVFGGDGVNQVNLFATLVGLETPRQSVTLEVKPYVISTLTTDKTTAVPINNNEKLNGGFDFKYGITRSLTADVTVNTDFSQVEEDQQQTNLTRFSLFFDEKRDFFLEGIGIFSFATLASAVRGQTVTDAEAPILFFSRQIGLSQGQTVPVVAGARLSGRSGPFSIGLLNIQTDDKDAARAVATNFSVATIKRNIFRRSQVGAIFTRRTPSVAINDSNIVWGMDGTFRFFRYVNFITYYAQTKTAGLNGNDRSYRGKFDYSSDRYAATLEHTMVGTDFNPEIGFVKRVDFRRSYALARFSPRTRTSRTIRKVIYQANYDYITNPEATITQNREAKGVFGIEFHSSDSVQIDYRRDYELLPRKFAISRGVTVPAGGYDYYSMNLQYVLGTQRMISGTVTASRGSLYGGNRQSLTYSGRAVVLSRFSIEPNVTLNWVSLPYGDFTTRLLGTRVVVTPKARLSVISLIQYNRGAQTVSSNTRLRWEYRPSSEFYIVYSDGRATVGDGSMDLLNRSLAIKLTRNVRF